jgi:hypothetical protein
MRGAARHVAMKGDRQAVIKAVTKAEKSAAATIFTLTVDSTPCRSSSLQGTAGISHGRSPAVCFSPDFSRGDS